MYGVNSEHEKDRQVTPPAASTKALRPNATVSVKTEDSFQNFQARLGWLRVRQPQRRRDYNPDFISRNRQLLDSMYRSSWICGKAVDTVADDMTREGIECHSEIDPGDVTELDRYCKAFKDA